MGKKGGKAPTGRAKQKQKAQRGPGSSPWQPPSGKVRHGWSDDDDDELPTFRGFAQNRMPSAFSPSTARSEARHRKVAFVSAGAATPPIEDKHHLIEEDHRAEQETNVEHSAVQSDVATDIDVPHQGIAEMDIQDAVAEMKDVLARDISEAKEEVANDLFVIDTAGDDQLNIASRNVAQPVFRASSPARSDSSEEQVVFLGRNKARVVNDPAPATFARSEVQALNLQPKATSIASDIKVSRQVKSADAWELANQLDLRSSTTIALGDGPGKFAQSAAPQGKWSPAPPGSRSRQQAQVQAQIRHTGAQSPAHTLAPQKPSKSPAAHMEAIPNANDLNAEDTIASLQAGWKTTLEEERNGKTAPAASHIKLESKAQIPSRRGKKGRKRGNRALKAAYTDSDDDEMTEAAYNDYMDNLAAQLDDDVEDTDLSSKHLSGHKAFAQSSGLAEPAFVVDGREYGENEKLPRDLKLQDTKVHSADDVDDSDDWESDDSEGSSASTDEDDQSDLEDNIEYNERQMWEDEDDLRQRRIQHIEDEEMARLFAKQEELGIGGDELVIEAGIYMDGVGDIDAARRGLADITSLVKPAKRSRRRGRGEPSFVDATALADTLDQYGDNGFDIMDFDRPSLRPTKKGRKGKVPPELEALSDDDLRETMQQSWENDRQKKRIKKLEREELRMDGLLGKGARTGIADLSAKYSTGMTLRQVFDELHEFLLLDLEQRAFPPMAKSDRKALHEVCTRLHLNSKSQGAGKRRFPIITKTSRTPGPGDATFEEFISFARSGTLSNVGQVYKLRNSLNRAGKGRERPARGPGASHAGTSLRNGEIVGASAAKIGSESFGHRMMQKMGWQEGKGLGQTGEGLVDPVQQRMRFGTAGLG